MESGSCHFGTQSYNPHPQTGMISVSEAFELVRRWNAKECAAIMIE